MAYDAIVIGAGHNGLAAAIHLAAKGWKVGVFERNGVAGGAVQTREATLPGFRHDLFAMNLVCSQVRRFTAPMAPRLRAMAFPLRQRRRHSRPHFPTGAGSASTRILRRRSPASANCPKRTASVGGRWPRLLRATRRIFSPFSAPSCLRSRSPEFRSRPGGPKVSAGCSIPLNLAVSSPREFLDRNFQSGQTQGGRRGLGHASGFFADVAGGALFPYLEAMANQSFGMAIGKGGADTMIRAMLGLLGELGGEVTLNAEVARIDAVNGRASGVTLADGRAFTASKAVIANVAPALVFGKLLPGRAASRRSIGACAPSSWSGHDDGASGAR